jgi:hypothetical protein
VCVPVVPLCCPGESPSGTAHPCPPGYECPSGTGGNGTSLACAPGKYRYARGTVPVVLNLSLLCVLERRDACARVFSARVCVNGEIVCVHVCIYVCVYMCVYVCIHVCACVRMYVYICVCIYVCVCVYTCVCMCAYVCVYICVCIYVCVCVCEVGGLACKNAAVCPFVYLGCAAPPPPVAAVGAWRPVAHALLARGAPCRGSQRAPRFAQPGRTALRV